MKHTLRTMIFVPGYQTKFLGKALSFKADALILDIEDSVPFEYKEDARKNIFNYLENNTFTQKLFVRVNSVESGLMAKDFEAVLHKKILGFMPTMIQDDKDIIHIDKMLNQLELDNGFEIGTFKLCPLIETGSAVLKAYEIGSATDRVIGLAFGGEDYLTDLDGLHKIHGTSLLTARSMIVMAARSLGKEVLDTPYLDVHNLDGFKKEVDQARELGFSGQLIIHPVQLKIANETFTPSEEEVAEATKIINAIEESKQLGRGVTLIDGFIIGPPMEKRARKILEKFDRIKALDSGI